MAARRWVFTLNNPATDDLPPAPYERYVSWQRERGASGTPHLQGYLECSRPVRLAALKAWLAGAHFEQARGSRDSAREYTRKEESREAGPFERGTWSAGGQGSRSDLEDAINVAISDGLRRAAELYPGAVAKFSRGIQEVCRLREEEPEDKKFEPRAWQSKVLGWLKEDPDDRHIIWVADSQGNKGKSRLCRHLCIEHGAILLEGKVQDMAYAYNRQRIVCFDITRGQAEMSDHIYSFAEKLKNGMIFSTKYESCSKVFSPPHVIIFANVFPKDGLWSLDRVRVLDLNNPDSHTL